MIDDLLESPLTTLPEEVITHDDAEVWLHVRVLVEDLLDGMAAQPDITARRKLVHAALQRTRREIQIVGSRDVQELLPLLALAESVLP